jgi:hypothetical protein
LQPKAKMAWQRIGWLRLGGGKRPFSNPATMQTNETQRVPLFGSLGIQGVHPYLGMK